MRSICMLCVALVLFASSAPAGQLPKRQPAQVLLTLTGLSTFKGALKGTCEIDPVEHRVTVEGQGPDGLFIRASVDYPAKGPYKVAIEGLGGGKGRMVGRVSTLVINKYNYVASAGSGTLEDAAGASGHMRAEGFIRAGGTMQTQNLTADLTWKCQ